MRESRENFFYQIFINVQHSKKDYILLKKENFRILLVLV